MPPLRSDPEYPLFCKIIDVILFVGWSVAALLSTFMLGWTVVRAYYGLPVPELLP